MIADQVRATGQETLAPGRGTARAGVRRQYTSLVTAPWIFPIDIKLSHPRRNYAEIKGRAEHPVERQHDHGKILPGRQGISYPEFRV